METMKFEVRSITPLLMHRYAGAKPSAEKAPRGKKTQTHIDAEYFRDWTSSAYWQDNTFHVPPEVVEAAIRDAAREFRLGKAVEKSLSVQEFFLPLRIFRNEADKTGYNATGELADWYKPEFVDIRGVSIGPSRIDRCRPIFRHWGLEFTVCFDPEKISGDNVRKAVAGMAIGDFRPRYGRSAIMEEKAA